MRVKLKIDKEKLVKKIKNFVYFLAQNAFLLLIFLFSLSLFFSAILFFKFEKEKSKILPKKESVSIKKEIDQVLELLEKK